MMASAAVAARLPPPEGTASPPSPVASLQPDHKSLTTKEEAAEIAKSGPQPPGSSPSGRIDLGDQELEAKRCRYCQSPSLYLDWAAGDRVCTSCGVVDEGHVRDDRPEWRDFNEAEDIVKGLPSASRSGLIPTDESRYIGGLQPTTLSRQPFGGSYGPSASSSCGGVSSPVTSEAVIRRRLLRTHRKIESLMERDHAESLRQAKVARAVMARRRAERGGNGGGPSLPSGADESQEEEEHHLDLSDLTRGSHHLEMSESAARRAEEALRSEKWSADRACLLHGTVDEWTGRVGTADCNDPHGSGHPQQDMEARREELDRRLDPPQRKAAAEVYNAVQMMNAAAKRLNLPLNIVAEAEGLLCRYASGKDGFVVRGVSSRLSDNDRKSAVRTKSGNMSASEEKEAANRQHDRNKLRQVGALGSALLYLTSKKNNRARTLMEVCGAFQYVDGNGGGSPPEGMETSVKPKHCSRAMGEVKATFPEYVRSVASVAGAVRSPESNNVSHGEPSGNFVEHTTKKLCLPAPAIEAIQILFSHLQREQREAGVGSGVKPKVLCASATTLVCNAGEVMQGLARQARAEPSGKTGTHIRAREGERKLKKLKVGEISNGAEKEKINSLQVSVSGDLKGTGTDAKKRKFASMDSPRTQNGKHPVKALKNGNSNIKVIQVAQPQSVSSDTAISPISNAERLGKEKAQSLMPKFPAFRAKTGDKGKKQEALATAKTEPFDAFSHCAIEEDIMTEKDSMTQQLWDAWSAQDPWCREMPLIEKSAGMPRKNIVEHYRKIVFPRRRELLELVERCSQDSGGDLAAKAKKEVALRHASPSRVLFRSIGNAASLMTLGSKL